MKKLLLLLCCAVLVGNVNASVLEWWDGVDTDDYIWNHGSLINTYTVDGVDVTIEFSGATAALYSSHSASYNQALPTDHWDHGTWSSSANLEALWWGNQTNVSSASPLTITISFNTTVENVEFSLYDLDGSEVIDLSSNSGFSVDPGSEIGFNPMTKILTGASGGNPGDEKNTATITFAQVDTIVMDYSANGGSGIMISNIEFLPEPATLVLLGLGAVALRRRK